MRTAYDAMIARARAQGQDELAECLSEERDERLIADDLKAREAKTDNRLRSAAHGLSWGHWNS